MPYNRKKEVMVPEEYEPLWLVNQKALCRVWNGKGKERHGDDGKSFTEQDICVLTREEGFGYPIGQARKKINEAKRMFSKGEKSKAINEILDASIYLQALALVMEEDILENWQNEQKGDKGFVLLELEEEKK